MLGRELNSIIFLPLEVEINGVFVPPKSMRGAAASHKPAEIIPSPKTRRDIFRLATIELALQLRCHNKL